MRILLQRRFTTYAHGSYLPESSDGRLHGSPSRLQYSQRRRYVYGLK
jgi:hypothetical protein